MDLSSTLSRPAAGHMEKTADGNRGWRASSCGLRFAPGAAPDAALAAMHDKAHHARFIANSVKTTITVEGI